MTPHSSPYVLHVCTSCRASGSPREPREQRPGYQLFQRLHTALQGTPLGSVVEVRPARCLSICPRPCGIALSSPGSWTYLFGDQDPGASVQEILQCVLLYVRTPDGSMPRKQRPQGLRGSILGRVPPINMGQ